VPPEDTIRILSMDEALILQTIGRLYLDNMRLQMNVLEIAQKDARIVELTRQVEQLTRVAIDESRGKK